MSHIDHTECIHCALQIPAGAAQEEEGGPGRRHGPGGDQRGGHAAGPGQVRTHGIQAPLIQETQGKPPSLVSPLLLA